MQRELAITKYEKALGLLIQKLSHSKRNVRVSEALLNSLQADEEEVVLADIGDGKWRNEHEPYRRKLT